MPIPVDPSGALDLLALAARIVEKLVTRRGKGPPSAEEDAAVMALLRSVGSTRHYIGIVKRGEERSRVAERQLSREWYETAVRLRRLDPQLALQAELKGRYWSKPDDWTTAQVRAARIEIERVEAAARALLQPSSKRRRRS